MWEIGINWTNIGKISLLDFFFWLVLDLPPTALHAVEEEAFLGLHTLEKHFFSIQGIFLFKRGKVILLLGLWKPDYVQTQPVLLLRGYLVVPSKGSLFIHSLFRISTSSFQDKGSGNVLPSFIKLFLIGMVRSINFLTACASSLLGSIQGKVLSLCLIVLWFSSNFFEFLAVEDPWKHILFLLCTKLVRMVPVDLWTLPNRSRATAFENI